MIPGVFTKGFECCYPRLLNIYKNRFYLVTNFHSMFFLIGVGLNSEAVINGNYILKLSNCYNGFDKFDFYFYKYF